VSLVQPPPWLVREQRDVGARWGDLADTREQPAEDRVADATALMVRHDGHVDDVEVPAAVADHPAHANGLSVPVDNMDGGPASEECCGSLSRRARGEPGVSPQGHVAVGDRRPFYQAVRITQWHAAEASFAVRT